MIPRTLWSSIAAAALLTAASTCLAQDAPVLTPPPADTTHARPAVLKPMGAIPGTGSLGGMMGGSYFYAADDYAAGAQPRMAFSAAFRYTMSSWLRWQVSPGFAWAAYTNTEPVPFPDPAYPTETTKDRHLSLVLPMSAQLQLMSARGRWLHHLGFGPGLYRVWVENHRKVIKDPVTYRVHRGLYPGATVELGTERYLANLPSVSVEAAATSHYVLATKDEDFPSGYNSALGLFEVRVGANYHFDLKAKPKKASADPSAAPPPAR
jgi:hypothetical protein